MKIEKRNFTHWWYLGLQALFTVMAIAVRPFLPKGDNKIVILYGHQFSSHLAAIYRQWRGQGSGRLTLYFLSLNPDPVFTDAEERVNVLYCQRLTDMLIVARASAIITDHNLHLMTPLVYLSNMVFIDVGHGIPFKGYDEDNFRVRRRYREIWTSSTGVSKLYTERCGCGGLVYALGSPRTDKLIPPHHLDHSFRESLKLYTGIPLILYAPTWQQDDQGRTLIPFGYNEEDFLEKLNAFCIAGDCYLIFRSHLNTKFEATSLERIRFCPQSEYPDTEAVLLESDVLISDWSSIVFDYLVLRRPTVFLDVPHPFEKGLTVGKEHRFGWIAGGMDDLLQALDTCVHNPDMYWKRYGENHEFTKSYVYGDLADGRASQRGMRRLEELLV